MRILLCIAVSVVHAMHYSICPWYQVRGTLQKPGGQIKHFFPIFTGSVHLMGSKPVKEKCMYK